MKKDFHKVRTRRKDKDQGTAVTPLGPGYDGIGEMYSFLINFWLSQKGKGYSQKMSGEPSS